MDEIDKIIVQSLRHIGCTFDDTAEPTALDDLQPDQLLPCVVRCLQLIQPDHPSTAGLPGRLPAGMAQRFAATTAVAEACVAAGFGGDLGYHTFLYSNVVEVRRVLMYLIERLPKEPSASPVSPKSGSCDRMAALEAAIGRNIRAQLDAAWTPQYCRKNGIVRFEGGDLIALQSSARPFRPHRLSVAHPTRTTAPVPSAALRDYWLKRSPTVFQQVTQGVDLCASLLHRNDVDRIAEQERRKHESPQPEKAATKAATQLEQRFERFLQVRRSGSDGGAQSTMAARTAATTSSNSSSAASAKSVQQLQLNNLQIPNADDIVSMPEISARDSLAFDIEKLKHSIEADAERRQQIGDQLVAVRAERETTTVALRELAAKRKVTERTQILLENPEVNVRKMREVLAASEARIKQLGVQWQAHRAEMVAELGRAQKAGLDSPSRQLHAHLKSTKERTSEIGAQLATKAALHAKLLADLQKYSQLTASRDDYTSRILEIIGNIRKQKADIAKVLQDTRGLQKEINTVSGQLDRQFTVTDDLMFKNAKRDEHAKAAYKHLATLHSDCGDLVRLVEETGAIVREVRELEDQIETEKSRNVAANLQRITNDLQLVVLEGQEWAARLETTASGAGGVAGTAVKGLSTPATTIKPIAADNSGNVGGGAG